MSANTRLSTATQILCVIAYAPSHGTTAAAIARSLDTNPVVVRRLLKDLAAQGLVRLQQGKHGGVHLARPPGAITLDAVHLAVGASAFALRPGGNPNCPVNRTMPALLAPIFGAADQAVAQALAQTTLASLAAQLPKSARSAP